MAIYFWLSAPKVTTLYVISFFRNSKKDATAIVIANIFTFKNIINQRPTMHINKIESQLKTLENNIKNLNAYNPKVSKVKVAWHIDHSLKVINNVVIALQKSDPATFKNNFSLLGKFFFALGFFPRGKAKAPKYVKPPEVILKEDLISQIKRAKTNIQAIASLDKNAYFKHPIFGNVNTIRVNRFLVLHTNHHLKIINDIIIK